MNNLTTVRAWSTPSLSPMQEGSTSSRTLISNEGIPAGARPKGVNSVHTPGNEQAATDVCNVIAIGNPRQAVTEVSADEGGVISADPLGGWHCRDSAAVEVLPKVT
jgi:hypothetical protein